MNRNIKTLIKVAITIVGLYLAYQQMDVATIRDILVNYDYRYLLAGIVLNCLGTVIISMRLREVFGNSQSLATMVKINFVAAFFNLFLPSTIGGDTVKVTRLAGGESSADHN